MEMVHGVREGPTMELNGYGQAVIHLAWIRNDETLHLLFGMVELRPTELPSDPGCPIPLCQPH